MTRTAETMNNGSATGESVHASAPELLIPVAPNSPAAGPGSIATMPAQPAATPTAPTVVKGGRFIAVGR
jgi:hypothetical protein